MFERLVSLVLILTVIACPMSCSNGTCQVDQCGAHSECSLEEQSCVSCPLHGSADGCTENSSQEHDKDVPSRCPDDTSCQGICGGAVFEKSCELNGPDSSIFLLMTAHHRSIASLLTQFRRVSAGQLHCFAAKNHGRFVRVLQMSFLC